MEGQINPSRGIRFPALWTAGGGCWRTILSLHFVLQESVGKVSEWTGGVLEEQLDCCYIWSKFCCVAVNSGGSSSSALALSSDGFSL